MTGLIRHPAVAGRFYPLDPDALKSALQTYLPKSERASPAVGCIVPHAGYMYSGHVAGAVFSELKIPGRVIILCPNHTGVGRPLAIMSDGEWETPLGRIPIDVELQNRLNSTLLCSMKMQARIVESTRSRLSCHLFRVSTTRFRSFPSRSDRRLRNTGATRPIGRRGCKFQCCSRSPHRFQ